MTESIEASRRRWLADLDELGRRMDEVEALIDRIVAKLLPAEVPW